MKKFVHLPFHYAINQFICIKGAMYSSNYNLLYFNALVKFGLKINSTYKKQSTLQMKCNPFIGKLKLTSTGFLNKRLHLVLVWKAIHLFHEFDSCIDFQAVVLPVNPTLAEFQLQL